MSNSRYENMYKQWRKEYDVHYFRECVYTHIQPFLHKHGYTIGVDLESLSKRLEAYCWAHEWVSNHDIYKTISYKEQIHNGTDDDYDWFSETIDTCSWEYLFNKITKPGIFDSSRAGSYQKIDFPLFMWRQLNLEHSKTYNKYATMRDLYLNDEYESEEWLHQDEP